MQKGGCVKKSDTDGWSAPRFLLAPLHGPNNILPGLVAGSPRANSKLGQQPLNPSVMANSVKVRYRRWGDGAAASVVDAGIRSGVYALHNPVENFRHHLQRIAAKSGLFK